MKTRACIEKGCRAFVKYLDDPYWVSRIAQEKKEAKRKAAIKEIKKQKKAATPMPTESRIKKQLRQVPVTNDQVFVIRTSSTIEDLLREKLKMSSGELFDQEQ